MPLSHSLHFLSQPPTPQLLPTVPNSRDCSLSSSKQQYHHSLSVAPLLSTTAISTNGKCSGSHRLPHSSALSRCPAMSVSPFVSCTSQPTTGRFTGACPLSWASTASLFTQPNVVNSPIRLS